MKILVPLILACAAFFTTAAPLPAGELTAEEAEMHSAPWTIIAPNNTGPTTYAIDIRSFQVLSAGDVFSYRFAIVTSQSLTHKDISFNAQVGVMKTSCKTGKSRITSDVFLSRAGKIVARNVMADEDTDSVAAPNSFPDLIAKKVCEGVDISTQLKSSRKVRPQLSVLVKYNI